MFSRNVMLSCIALAVFPVLIWATKYFQTAMKSAFEDERSAISKLNTFVQEHISGMKIVQIFNREQAELENFKRKVDAGANSALTQYFYNADSYFAFVDEASRIGIDVPIIPGIMPITNYLTLTRFSDICGAELPRWIRARLHQYQDDEASLKAFGLDVVSHLCLDLLDNGVEGLHFYALNKVEPVKEICTRIGFIQSE
jgi:ABC-type multidrug transport system fused ATPase/permease subunit